MRQLRRDVVRVLPAWIVTRVIVVGALVVGHLVFDRVRTPGQAEPIHLHHGLASWDAEWYQRIADDGYAKLPQEALRFFPLWPLLARVLAPLFAGSTPIAVIALANMFALTMLVALWRVTQHVTNDEASADRAVWLASLTPIGLVFVLGYAEALTIAASIVALGAAMKRKWWMAAVAGLVVGASRPLGLILVVPLAIEALSRWRQSTARERLVSVGASVAPLFGCAAYLVWVEQHDGDGLLPFRIQRRPEFGRAFAFPITRLIDAIRDGVHGQPNQLGHLAWVAIFVVLVVMMVRMKMRPAWIAWSAILVVLAVSADNIDSLERYCLSAFPFFIAGAQVLGQRRWRSVELAVTVGLGATLALYSVAAFFTAYVP